MFLIVVIDSGSRYEVAYPSGVSHFLEKLAFGVISKEIIKYNFINYTYTILFLVYPRVWEQR